MQYVVMAGGKGSRSESAIPKILRKINDQMLLERIVSNIAKNAQVGDSILFLLGYQADLILEEIKRIKSRYEIRIQFNVEISPLGTANALNESAELLEDEFVIILGDLFFDFDFKNFIGFAQVRKAKFVATAHPNGHAHDSDLIILDPCTARITKFNLKTENNENRIGIALAGIFYFKDCKDLFRNAKQSQKNFMNYLIDNNKLIEFNSYGYVTIEYIKDSGTPNRLKEIEEAESRGEIRNRSLSFSKPAIFLDLDDTLLKNEDTDCEISADILYEISIANNYGIPIIVVSNQPVVAKGVRSLEEVAARTYQININAEKKKAFIDLWYWCPHHPEFGFREEVRVFKVPCSCRKPEIGLFEFAESDHKINLYNSFFVGDSIVDFKAATKANLTFLHSKQFHKCDLEPNHLCFERSSIAIRYAVDELRVN